MQRLYRKEHLNFVKCRNKMLFLCVILAGTAWTLPPLSLEDCVKMAKERSLEMESARLSERASEAALNASRTSRYPTLSAHVNQSLYDSPFNGKAQDHYRFSMGISGSYTLWDGGATGIDIESKQLSLEASKFGSELSALTVQEKAMNAFVELLAAKEALAIAYSAVELSDSLVLYHERLLEAGTITRSELSLAKSDAASAKVKLVSAEQTERSAKTSLRQILEISRSDALEILSPETALENPSDLGDIPPFETVLAETRKHYPGLVSDSLKVLAAEKNVTLAGKNSSIAVTLGADASTGFQAWESDRYGRQLKNGYTHSVMLGISIPLIDGGMTQAKILSAQVENERAKVTRRETGKNLENSLEQLYMQAESADAGWLAAIASLESAQESFAVAVEQRNAGSLTFTDFLEQKNNLQNAQSVLIQAKYTSILARKLLELYMGNF